MSEASIAWPDGFGPLLYIDTETGGVTRECSTLQVACVDQVGAEFSTFVRHEPMVVTTGALAYNKLDLRASVDWPDVGEVRLRLLNWLAQCTNDRGAVACTWRTRPFIACGFNVRFDVERVNELCGEPVFSYRTLDLTSVALAHGIPCRSADLVRRYGGDLDEAHDALHDARMARLVHEGMVDEFGLWAGAA